MSAVSSMAVYLVRRKRTCAIIFLLGLLLLFVFYQSSDRITANPEQFREIQEDNTRRVVIDAHVRKKGDLANAELPVKTYQVVTIEDDEKLDEAGTRNDEKTLEVVQEQKGKKELDEEDGGEEETKQEWKEEMTMIEKTKDENDKKLQREDDANLETEEQETEEEIVNQDVSKNDGKVKEEDDEDVKLNRTEEQKKDGEMVKKHKGFEDDDKEQVEVIKDVSEKQMKEKKMKDKLKSEEKVAKSMATEGKETGRNELGNSKSNNKSFVANEKQLGNSVRSANENKTSDQRYSEHKDERSRGDYNVNVTLVRKTEERQTGQQSRTSYESQVGKNKIEGSRNEKKDKEEGKDESKEEGREKVHDAEVKEKENNENEKNGQDRRPEGLRGATSIGSSGKKNKSSASYMGEQNSNTTRQDPSGRLTIHEAVVNKLKEFFAPEKKQTVGTNSSSRPGRVTNNQRLLYSGESFNTTTSRSGSTMVNKSVEIGDSSLKSERRKLTQQRSTREHFSTTSRLQSSPRVKGQSYVKPTVQGYDGASPAVKEVKPEVPLACKVPKLNPFHPHVSKLIEDVGTDLRSICLARHPLTPVFKVVGNHLVLRKGVVPGRISEQSVTLKEIHRKSDFTFSYANEVKPFQNGLSKSSDIGHSDFFRVNYEIDGKLVSDLFARVSPRTDILKEQLKTFATADGKGIPLNVLIIGFDSTSKANFERKMGRVVSFLKTQLTTYFMEGMSINGDATTPILTAMLTGKHEEELPEGRRSFSGKPIDNWPWIMKDYAKRGYMTLFAEDDPSVSAFNLRLTGFKKSPTHHYMRSFWLSLEDEGERDEPGLCSKSQSMTNFTLKYIKSFFDAYPTARKFAFGFMSYLAHAHPNHLSYAEDDLLWFLRTFVKKGYHKDTIMIIMGDHGSRNDEYRDTMQGKLEERLPWFSVSLPSMFHQRFPELAANLRNNQAIISSPFDVHATLRQILTYPEMPRDELTQSLFEKLPRSRTCSDAGIASHWCPCLNWSKVDATSKQIQAVALAAVARINKELSRFRLLQTSCHVLTLDSVQNAIRLEANSKVQHFAYTDQDGDRSVQFEGKTSDLVRYQIIFTTRPNYGKYEATASVSAEHVSVNPEISRINRYNDQPKCIARQYPHARKFCFCRTSA